MSEWWMGHIDNIDNFVAVAATTGCIVGFTSTAGQWWEISITTSSSFGKVPCK